MVWVMVGTVVPPIGSPSTRVDRSPAQNSSLELRRPAPRWRRLAGFLPLLASTHARDHGERHPAGMAAAGIGLRRLASQRIVASRRCREPAGVVRHLCAVQAQDYSQSLWAIGARLRAGTARDVERAIEERRILRTWLLRGTIHFAAPEDVRWLLALVAPRLATAETRRCEQLGLDEAQFARCAELLSSELRGDRRLSRPEVMRLFEAAGIDTAGQRGYHILVRLAKDALICFGPLRGKQQTFVLLDEWAPRAESRDLSREEALPELARRFAVSRGPVTDHDLARWAGIAVSDARRGLAQAVGLSTRVFDGAVHWLAAEEAARATPTTGRTQVYLLAGFDEFVLGYQSRDAVLDRAHAQKVAPGSNGVFKPLIVVGGRVVGTWARSRRRAELGVALHPFATVPKLAERATPELARYREFLGLPSELDPVVRVDGAAP
jgi:hypothetical protein